MQYTFFQYNSHSIWRKLSPEHRGKVFNVFYFVFSRHYSVKGAGDERVCKRQKCVTLPNETNTARSKRTKLITVLLPENLHTYFELSVQAWTLYKAP